MPVRHTETKQQVSRAAEFRAPTPTVIRVLFVVLAVLGGAGALIYLATWLIVPEEP